MMQFRRPALQQAIFDEISRMISAGDAGMLPTIRSAARASSFSAALLFLGCQSITTSMHREIVSSIQFDELTCDELAALRDQEAARFDLPRNAKVDHSRMLKIKEHPLGSLIPVMRSKAEQERRIAIGRIDAMNRSLVRRDCEGAEE